MKAPHDRSIEKEHRKSSKPLQENKKKKKKVKSLLLRQSRPPACPTKLHSTRERGRKSHSPSVILPHKGTNCISLSPSLRSPPVEWEHLFVIIHIHFFSYLQSYIRSSFISICFFTPVLWCLLNHFSPNCVLLFQTVWCQRLISMYVWEVSALVGATTA